MPRVMIPVFAAVLMAAGALSAIEVRNADGVIPEVDAEIIGLKSSPDYTRVALLLSRRTSSEREERSVALFDPASRRILAQSPGGEGAEDLYWSPDSRWLAAPNHPERSLVLLRRDGQVKRVRTDDYVSEVVWRQDKPGSYFYRGSGVVVEGDTESGSKRSVKVGYNADSIFLVRGKLCFSYTLVSKQGTRRVMTAYVREVNGGRMLLKVPLYGYSTWDPPVLTVSPDGRHFFSTHVDSGSTLNVVARAQDAPDVFKQPHKALMLQTDIMDEYSVTWFTRTGKWAEKRDAAIIRRARDFFMLDLFTGSRDSPIDRYLWPAHVRLADLWKPENDGMSRKDWIYVTKRGLEAFLDKRAKEPVLLLRHKVNEIDEPEP